MAVYPNRPHTSAYIRREGRIGIRVEFLVGVVSLSSFPPPPARSAILWNADIGFALRANGLCFQSRLSVISLASSIYAPPAVGRTFSSRPHASRTARGLQLSSFSLLLALYAKMLANAKFLVVFLSFLTAGVHAIPQLPSGGPGGFSFPTGT